MNDETFARLVAEDVKNKSSDAQKKYLRLPENIVRWKRALEYLANNLQDQMTSIDKQESERLKQYEFLGSEGEKLIAEASSNAAIRRSKIERFHFFVNAKLDEVVRMASTNGTQENSAEDFYRKAIQRWWSLMQEFEMEPTRVDVALHASLDGLWEFDDLSVENNFDDFEN